jgi:hypothetical protein
MLTKLERHRLITGLGSDASTTIDSVPGPNQAG